MLNIDMKILSEIGLVSATFISMGVLIMVLGFTLDKIVEKTKND